MSIARYHYQNFHLMSFYSLILFIEIYHCRGLHAHFLCNVKVDKNKSGTYFGYLTMTDHLVDISTTFSSRQNRKDSNYVSKSISFLSLKSLGYLIVNQYTWC